MRGWWVLLAGLPLLEGGVIPNRYIVQLSEEPVAAHALRTVPKGRPGMLQTASARRYRDRLHTQQRAARAQIEQLQATVLDSADTIANALFVRIPDAQAARLAQVPGVVRVWPVREYHLLLDHALPVHKVPDAWNLVGVDKAGLGIKIGMIDTGIDISHPGMQDPSLRIPDGFPRVNSEADKEFTNQKVIVARSYATMFPTTDPDPSARDHFGHGTGTAMAAAGAQNTGPDAVISGVAPKAYLGSYKVFGSPGVNEGAPEDAILKALDDAVADGMDVINMSLGTDVAPRPLEDPEAQALELAASAGVIVVVAAGNNGPDPGTLASPATAPSVIAVGASQNDRAFVSQGVTVGDRGPYGAVPGNGPQPPAVVSGPLVDVAALGGDGMACAALPKGSLNGAIALILRGVCTFQVKLTNAQDAGAVGAIVYTDEARPTPNPMEVGGVGLPAEMISYQDGLDIKQHLSGPVQATLRFGLGPAAVNPNRIADFSAKGPNMDGTIKPDLVAVGTNVYTAGQKTDARGDLYSASGYKLVQGTSFSAPLVAGAAALVKSARPGLTSAQYRSLLVNSAAPISLDGVAPSRVQEAGAGVLDASAAVRSTVTVWPLALNFGSGGSDVQATQTLTITNVGGTAEQFQLGVFPRDAGPAPLLPAGVVQLEPQASSSLSLSFSGTRLDPGQYEGFVVVESTKSGVQTRIPYWYGVASGTPQYITTLRKAASLTVGSTTSNAIIFRIMDGSGIPLITTQPVVTVVSGNGRVVRVRVLDGNSPGAFAVSLAAGQAGANVFRIEAGPISKDVTFDAN